MGVPLLVMETGNRNGPPILFIHGMSQSHLSWEPQFNSELAQKYRLVAFDMRGHGGSGKPWDERDYAGSQIWGGDVAAVIDGLGLKDVTIVAWSFGGFVAVSYVRHYGTQNVRAINLSGTLGGLIEFPRKPSKDYDKILEGSKMRGSLDLRANIEGYRAMPNSFTAQPMAAKDRETAFVTGLMNPSYVRRAMRKLPLQNYDMVDKINVPVLITVGTTDLEWPDDIADQLASELPDGRISTYDNKGHFPSLEDAGRFNRELDELVRSSRK
ncbi:alpha/beta fold hydrolase [Parasphingorhabdus cellanae]|uniref:Alpha/beta hydrolase n=1 Tax=Parasphingorhabdus cellanae TaxID=2806553 RepID=A0ABX7TAN4_9SPHN|nr:alpha/beta hydrolase [Parasphingorhabdus cellanae]QTD57283.1 alpha/beta hydrolase [Parasphingorhabdus cellanae]